MSGGPGPLPLGEYGLDATDLADAVHLAAVMKQAADGTSRLRYGHLAHLPFTEPLPPDPASSTAVPRRHDAPAEEPEPARGAAEGPAPVPAVPIDDPAHQRLEDRSALLSAFSLFNLKVPRGRPEHPDLADTARNYARALLDTAHWEPGEHRSSGVPVLPALRPGTARTVRLALVIDTGVSMLFQRGVTDDLTRLLRRSGVFRSVDLLGFDSRRPGPPLLAGPDGRPRHLRPPGETGPHVTLFVTDGLGAAWGDAGFQDWMAGAARGGAVAVLHLLRPQLWRRGSIRTVPTRIRASWPASPGGPNTGYVRERSRAGAAEEERPRGTLIPVLPLRAAAVHDWASFTMVRSRSRLWVHAAEYPDPGARAEPEVPEGEGVLRFRRTASPEAFELAVALAAVPLHPAVVSEVCRDVLGAASPSELTEVFFSGLVRLADGVLDEDPGEEIRWDFRTGVRTRLLALGGQVPEIRRMLRLAVRVLGGRDPWFEDLARMLDGEHVGMPQAGAGARVWVEAMLPAVESAAVARRYRAPVDVYARNGHGHHREGDRP